MAGRHKFRIPIVNDTLAEDVKTFSLFKSYQQNKNKSEMPSEATATVKPAVSTAPVNVKAAAPVPTSLRQESAKSTTASLAGQCSSLKSSSTASKTTTAVSSALPTLGQSSMASSSTASATGSSGGKAASSNSIIVNYRQRGNPILKHIRNVAWEFGSIVPDYVMGVANCALFLSLRYHQLHSDYLHNRLKELGKGYDLRVLLVQVDVKDSHHQLKDLAKICILADLTLILAFSPEEAGRYLEAYKIYENKPAEVLMEKTDTDYVSKLTECLTTVKSVNKTDCMTLLSAFKSMNGMINASKEDITMCAGFGPQKAQRLSDVLHEPFLKCRKRPKDASTDSRNSSPVKKPT